MDVPCVVFVFAAAAADLGRMCLGGVYVGDEEDTETWGELLALHAQMFVFVRVSSILPLSPCCAGWNDRTGKFEWMSSKRAQQFECAPPSIIRSSSLENGSWS